MIVALAGGVGGAKLALGLSVMLPPGELAIVVNTSDDFTHLGLHVSPDLDTVTYTLAGIANPATGWGVAEESWTKLGGMDDRAEVHGSEGVAFADLLHGNAIETYSAKGYDYAVEKAGSTAGWSFTIYEEAWNYGFPQEMAHFVDCVQNDKAPLVTGDDGRKVLEAVFAAYESARRRALRWLDRGFHLGGRAIPRDVLHER